MAKRCLVDVMEQAHGRVKWFCIHGPKDSGVSEGRVARRLVGHPLPGELEVILRSEFP